MHNEVTQGDRNVLLLFARDRYSIWPRERANAIRRELPSIIEAWRTAELATIERKWREIGKPLGHKRFTVVKGKKKIKPEKAEPWEITGLPVLQGPVDLVTYLLAEGGDNATELRDWAEYYGLDYLLSVLMIDNRNGPIGQLIRASSYLSQHLLSRAIRGEFSAKRKEHRRPRAGGKVAALLRGAGKTKAWERRQSRMWSIADSFRVLNPRARRGPTIDHVHKIQLNWQGFGFSRSTVEDYMKGYFRRGA